MKPSPRAFTLVETIIAMTIFAAIATTAVMLLTEVSKIRQEVQMEEFLYTETQALLEQMSRTIQESAIDYEEYYSREVLGEPLYGQNYGEYHTQFYNPISQFDTGKNPYSGSGLDEDTANAFCDENIGGGAFCSSNTDYHQADELYLLNSSGDIKTIYTLENDSDGNQHIAKVQLEGSDNDNTDNLLMDTWVCTADYTCTLILGTLPHPNDRTDSNRDPINFIPISSSHIAIDDLSFFISPIEDPYKGFDETSSDVFFSAQNHPKVTIHLTAHYQTSNPVGGQTPTVTLQTTVGTGVYGKIPSISGI